MDPIDLSDPELEKAATKIQATFKGYKVRKEITGKDAPGDAATEASSSAQQLEEEIDIDLNDPEVEKAATKIQATFKGYKVRRAGQKKD